VNFKNICVIGLGYIGLPTASTFAAHGINVLGVDISPHIIETINKGEIHIHEPGLLEEVQKAIHSGKLKAAAKPEEADAFIIAVPTPFQHNQTGEYNGLTYKLADMRAVISAAESIVPFLRKGRHARSDIGSRVHCAIFEEGESRCSGIDFPTTYYCGFDCPHPRSFWT